MVTSYALVRSRVEFSESGWHRRLRTHLFPLWRIGILFLAIVLLHASCEAQSPTINQIAIGSAHTLALKNDGTVWAWGANFAGALGNGTEVDSAVPVQVSGLSGVVAVAAGYYSSYAIKNDGTVWAWGYNGDGELGRSSGLSESDVPLKITQLHNIVALAPGYYHCVAVDSTGNVWTWGANWFGGLGNGTTTNHPTPIKLTTLSGVTAVAAGAFQSCALRSDGTLRAWGYNGEGELGDSTTIDRHAPVQVSLLSNVVALSAGAYHGLAIENGGALWAWGRNDCGQLGNNSTTDTPVPFAVNGMTNVVAVSGALAYTFARKSDGTLWTWGDNSSGELGDGTLNPSLIPKQFNGVSNVAFMAAGWDHPVAVTSDGTVWAWGNNTSFQLGDSLTGDGMLASADPIEISGLNGVTAIAAGMGNSIALTNDGKVWTWGANANGQLGNGTTTPSAVPISVSTLTNVKVIGLCAGYYHFLTVTNTGAVYAWGANTAGQLGNGTTNASSVPVSVGGLNNRAAAVAAGNSHSVALLSDGTVWAWGDNSASQLGTSSTTLPASTAPVQVGGLSNIVAISAANTYSLALDRSGIVWGWGSGWLGNGTTGSSPVPLQVSGLSNIAFIAAGLSDALAIDVNGNVWTWGANGDGELGNDTADSSPVPVLVSSLSNATVGSVGSEHMLAVKNDRTVWGWGWNGYGQLGGYEDETWVPVQVSGLNGARQAAAGWLHSLILKEDGTVTGLGAFSSGELGSGLTTLFPAPKQILGFHLSHTAPQAAFVNPAPGTAATVVLGQSQTLQFSTTAGDSAVSAVQLWQQGVQIQTVSSSVGSFSWQPATWGGFDLTLIAVDQNGVLSTRSDPITLQVPYDSDGNGLPDWWELKYFGYIGVNPTALSPSGDGLTNMQEYLGGFSPLDPAPVLTLTSPPGATLVP